MRTERDRLEILAEAVAKAEPDFDGPKRNVALATYLRLAEGSPASVTDIAQRAGEGAEFVESVLASWPGVYRNEDGYVVGFWGLTIEELVPTHSLEVRGHQLYTWCAWDTLFLPGLLGAEARVESACPITGETISLVVDPDRVAATSHPNAVLSFLVPERGFDADIIQSFCHFVHFFSSPGDGERWTAEHPGTFLLSLEEAFELGRRVNELNFPALSKGMR